MKLSKKQTVIALIFITLIVIFNGFINRNELSISSEVNDNSFQVALVNDAKQIISHTGHSSSIFYLIDSFNERWNEGFSLSSYYSHLPQAVIALTGTLLQTNPYTVFTIIKFLFLVGLPLSFFAAGLILGQGLLFASIFAFLSHATFTDGLYGIDISSFLWRGWGLSSQLFAVFFMPLAFAFSYKYIKENKHLGKALLCNFLLASCHSGVFLMVVFSYPVIAAFEFYASRKREILVRFAYLILLLTLLLAYFFIPFFVQGNYRNFSYWDPIWKFNSYGLIPVLSSLLNGQLFDSGRLPFVTLATVFGFLYGIISKNKFITLCTVLFTMYFCFYIGKSPFGPLIDKIPGLSEFHLHRFIVVVQFVGIFLGTYAITYTMQKISKYIATLSSEKKIIAYFISFLLGFWLIFSIEQPIIKYASENGTWIVSANDRYSHDKANYQALTTKLTQLGQFRIYAGRPGNWGRDFKVGDTPIYMALAQDGFRTISYAPESWSPNAEADQFFEDTNRDHYLLYNVQFAVYPNDVTPPQFATSVATFGKYHLYKLSFGKKPLDVQPGWFTFGKSNLVIVGAKTNFINTVHLWLTSKMFADQNYPHIIFSGDTTNFDSKYYYYLNDLNHYKDNNDKEYSLWERNPVEMNFGRPEATVQKISEHATFQTYSADFTMNKDCKNCIVILKQTYHPNWHVTVNGIAVKTYPVFPFYIGIPIEKTGKYHIDAIYQPNTVKILLLLIGAPLCIVLAIFIIKKKPLL